MAGPPPPTGGTFYEKGRNETTRHRLDSLGGQHEQLRSVAMGRRAGGGAQGRRKEMSRLGKLVSVAAGRRRATGTGEDGGGAERSRFEGYFH
jgi:hypothetical protein